MEGFLAVDSPIVDGLAFDVLYQPAAAIEQLGGDRLGWIKTAP
jgi:hypothetical protein